MRPSAVSRQELLKVHTPEYLRSLRSPETLARILEVPIIRRLPVWLVDWRILRPMRFATGDDPGMPVGDGERVAINLGGGYHHAADGWGGGFCVYADAPLAAKVLHDEGRLGNVLVVDLDAHQGNGSAAIFQGWPWAVIFDLYQRDLFPVRKRTGGLSFACATGFDGGRIPGIRPRTLCPPLSMPSSPILSSTTPGPTRSWTIRWPDFN